MTDEYVEVEAIADFKAARFSKDAGRPELSFKQGETFRMLAADNDAGWGQGEINGEIGWFPLSYIKILYTEDRSPAYLHHQLNLLVEREKEISEQQNTLKKQLDALILQKKEIQKEMAELRKTLNGDKTRKSVVKVKSPEKRAGTTRRDTPSKTPNKKSSSRTGKEDENGRTKEGKKKQESPKKWLHLLQRKTTNQAEQAKKQERRQKKRLKIRQALNAKKVLLEASNSKWKTKMSTLLTNVACHVLNQKLVSTTASDRKHWQYSLNP